jgi:hypothetical protein
MEVDQTTANICKQLQADDDYVRKVFPFLVIKTVTRPDVIAIRTWAQTNKITFVMGRIRPGFIQEIYWDTTRFNYFYKFDASTTLEMHFRWKKYANALLFKLTFG